VEGGAEGGARVAGGGLHPDLLEGTLPVQHGVGDAVQRGTAGHREDPVAGALVQPAREVEQDLLEAALHAGGQVGVRARPVLVGPSARRQFLPVDPLGDETAVVGGPDGGAHLVEEPGLAVRRERHDLVLVGGAQEAQVRGEGLVRQAE
jgi:hypothetical protein